MDGTDLGSYKFRVSDRLISSAESLVSYSTELISSARSRRSSGLNHISPQFLTFLLL